MNKNLLMKKTRYFILLLICCFIIQFLSIPTKANDVENNDINVLILIDEDYAEYSNYLVNGLDMFLGEAKNNHLKEVMDFLELVKNEHLLGEQAEEVDSKQNSSNRSIGDLQLPNENMLHVEQKYLSDLHENIEEYVNSTYDIIITMGMDSLAYVDKHYQFFGEPSVVSIRLDEAISLNNIQTSVQIIDENYFEKTFDIAASLHPEIKKVIIYGSNQQEVIDQMRKKRKYQEYEIIYKEGFSVNHILTDVISVGNDAIIIPLDTTSDGNTYHAETLAAVINSVTDLPIYSKSMKALDRGIVGGYMESPLADGMMIAEAVLNVTMNNQIGSSVKVRKGKYCFDNKLLKKQNISDSLLPDSSIVINKERAINISYTVVIAVIVTMAIAFLLLIILMYNVIKRRRAEKKIKHMAYHDTLTGLYNRAQLYNELDLIFEKRNSKSALIFLDLDNFKNINDVMGHFYGDQLLIQISKDMKKDLSKKELLIRLSGDEFIILIKKYRNRKQVLELADHILSVCYMQYSISNRQFQISASLGVAFAPEHGKDKETFLRKADLALYKAKQTGKNKVIQYNEALDIEIQKRAQMENDLRQAISNNEFQIYYQPKVDLQSKRITGCEALIRWIHPERGIVSPGEFIPLAEETGLIVPIGEWVLRESCNQIKRMTDKGFEPLEVSVNVSVRQFQETNLVELIKEILEETDFDPKYLGIEITESLAMEDYDNVIKTIKELKAMGIQILLDDFGTGYSSINYLAKLPVTVLKIDRSFVKDIESSELAGSVVNTIIQLAHAHQLKVVAEGVETKEQVSYLVNNSCEEIQGYYYSPPLNKEKFEAYVTQFYEDIDDNSLTH